MAGRIFLHHAHGFALAGSIKQPFEAEIDSHAAVSLSMVGGYASSKAESYRFRDLISYSSAHTYISSIKKDEKTYSITLTADQRKLLIYSGLAVGGYLIIRSLINAAVKKVQRED